MASPFTRWVLFGVAVAASVATLAIVDAFEGEARPDTGLASRFALPEAERAARRACESQAPFVVLDTFAHFKPANIDDAGGEPSEPRSVDLQHGDIVAAIVESSHAGVLAYQTNPIFNVRTLAADFSRLAGDIETGRLPKPAAIVSSIVLPVDIGLIAAREGAPAYDQATLAGRRGEMLKTLSENSRPGNPYAEIDRELRRLSATGVPIFVAAGNTAPDDLVNALALSEGVFAVGALDRDGAPASYTSAPGLVSVWSPGFVVLSEAPGGLSVSGGRRVELEGAGLPDQKAIIGSYSGVRAADVVREMPEWLKLYRGLKPSRQRNRFLTQALSPGLYPTEDLMAAYGYDASLQTTVRATAEGPYMHFPSDTIFQADAEGKLRFDPVGDGSRGQLKVADATSFAAPNVCARSLLLSRADQR